ncbi:sodium/proline symporter [Sedimentibacter sp. MB31-C6]|uniref:sodium/proline symporter n=1 Tax=Sedimentibacter sp. MB31-C6 TaxID=3109366 RepID=UPI002DDCA483|nr:sodium/proline symporter [Sedimentibacter sp. MB36-C1]WSI05347.1 sodium/proline symporter [Sedimentibacter sp. MB36-C1]
MKGDTLQILVSMIIYMTVIIGIGLYFAKRANESSENYFLGGRSLGPFVTAMSAEASDMSGWLLMGLPGVAYWFGLSDALWTAIGLGLGTYLNWLLVARRLHSYSIVAGDSITLPDFFSNRFKEKNKIIMIISAVFILVFFTVYASSCFVTVGKLFSTLFGFSYQSMMIIGAVFVLVYTYIGGFLAETASDTMQGVVMIFALVTILVIGTAAAGGAQVVLQNAKSIPGFFEFFGIASPTVEEGVQQVINGQPQFGDSGSYGLYTILSTMAWGLGYFGMPQVLLRFMAIRDSKELVLSRRIATIWVFISLFSAVAIGIIGRSLFPIALQTQGAAENIFIVLSSNLLPSFIAGIVMAGILAATISSSDSYLLIAASAFAKNIYQGIVKKDASDSQVMNISRVILMTITLIGIIIALDENSIIFTIVSFAWAGFGATFGPITLFSLFWKRTTREGAIAGMLSGGIMVFFWKLVLKPMGGIFGVYELLPAFIISCILIYVVSKMTREPSEDIMKEFELAKSRAK